MEETRKRVAVEYKVDDHAGGALTSIAAKSDHAGRSVGHLKERVKEFRIESIAMAAGVLGLGLGVGALVEKVKAANIEFGSAQKGIASTQATILDWPKSMSAVDKFTSSMKLAKNVTNELDDAAAEFGMQLPDAAAAYKTIGISAAPLHLSQKQWLDLTIKSVAAAKQFGISGEEAANTIGKALVTKSIRASSDLGKFLHEEVGGNLKKLNNAQVLAKMDKALGQSTEIAKKMGEGFGGSIVRIQNKVEDLLRDVSGPLFGAAASALDGLAGKLAVIEDNGKTTLDNYAENLVGAFNSAADVSQTILNLWGGIAAKVKDVTGGVGSLGGAGTGAAAGAYLGGPLGALVGAGAGAIGGEMFSQKMAHDKSVERLKAYKEILSGAKSVVEGQGTSDVPGSDMAEQQRRAKPFISEVERMGIQDPGVRREKIGEMRELIAAAGEDTEKALGMSAKEARGLSEKLKGIIANFDSELSPSWLRKTANPEDLTKSLRTTGKPQINFTGENHFDFKFEETDPDRVFLRFREGFENQLVRRTASVLSEPLVD